MTGMHPHRSGATVGIAAAGLLLGHWLAYALGSPQAHAREQLLNTTGHGYLPYAIQVALLAAVLGLVTAFLTRRTDRSTGGSFAGDAARLAVVQTTAFAAMEIGERLLAGASLHDLTHGPLLVIGLCVQVAVALAGAGLLRLTERAADLVDSLGGESCPVVISPIVLNVAATRGVGPRPMSMRAAADRAPPLLP